MFKVTIERDQTGEKFELTVTARDILMWERTTKGASLAGFQDNARMTDMYAMAFFAAKRAGVLESGTLLKTFETDYDVDFNHDDVADGEGKDESSFSHAEA
jgi:hypothetical protein